MSTESTEATFGGSENESPITAELREAVRAVVTEMMSSERANLGSQEKVGEVDELRRQISELSRQRDQMAESIREERRVRLVRDELERLGVGNIDLAYRAVQQDIVFDDTGDPIAMRRGEKTSVEEHLRQFVNENPELLPARITGGAGVSGAVDPMAAPDINSIRPGMSEAELGRVRAEIAKLASWESVRKA